ncbi:hypothetical protein BT96DRAFT_993097 [Gymnopus androsaceus JB14]|uniref:Uncharacterized protein n=1 Tax=Gymnopus androsaceus JB14 TaxID=1447944 RepID=A0A6A4HSX2_9AGAR|nr:hypothetical protein BT96DRAFT_993097 [Gymnopus androsaceus JB14]
MAHLNSRSYNSYRQPPSFFTSLEEAIQHVARSTRIACPNNPLSPSADRVGPPGHRRIVKSLTFQSSPTQSDGWLPCKLGTTVLPSAAPPPSTLPPHGVQIVHGPTIRIPPPIRPVPSDCPQAPSVPLRVGDTIIPPGSDLARELEAFEATEAQNAAASKARFFKDQEDACLAAAETKLRLELEQQRKENGRFPARPLLPPPLLLLLPLRHPFLPSTLPHFPPVPALDRWSPVPRRTWSPPRLLERPGLDGAAYSRAHLNIASGRDPAMTDLRDAYGDSQWLNPIHLVHWEPLPPMPVLRTNDVGALQQELSDMQRRLNSSQLDLETERERMLKNHQVEYEMLKGEVRALADSAAASAASAAQAKAYKALDPAARIEDLEGILARYEVELRKLEEGRGVAVDRAICREHYSSPPAAEFNVPSPSYSC